jgi:hypothetical protein
LASKSRTATHLQTVNSAFGTDRNEVTLWCPLRVTWAREKIDNDVSTKNDA